MNEEHISDPAIVNRLLTAMDCPASECLCEYEGKHLVSLHIRRALSIHYLPPEIALLRQLRVLRLTGQWKLNALPSTVGQLESLEVLELSDCWLSSLPPEIGLLNNLHTLRVQDTHALTQLPEEIGKLARLSTLSLAGNQLTHLTPAIGQLGELVSLDLNSNELHDLPAELGRLSLLRSLDLSYNLLTHLPAELGQLGMLEALRLEHNDLRVLPEEVGQLPNLESLTLDWNILQELPRQTGRLARLLTLSLKHNQLTSLPEELALLSRLEHLHLEQNQLNTLPQALAQLPYLHPLILDGNPLETISTELLTRLTELPAFGDETSKDEAGNVPTPEHVQHEEIWLDDEQFYLIDASQASHLPRIQVNLPSTVDINLNQVTLQSNRQQHYVWIRLELWGDEPPLPAGQWDMISDPDKTFHLTAGSPSSGTIYFCDALGEKLSRKAFSLGEANKYYNIRVLCRGRAVAREATWNDSHPPRGYEQYLLQFWQYRPKPSGKFSFSSLTRQSGFPPDPSPLPEDGKILEQMATRLHLDLSDVHRRYQGEHITELNFKDKALQFLREFPRELLRLTHLSSLYLGGLQLTSLWSEIGLLSSLKVLYLSDNQLTTLPPEIGLLSNLESLEIRQNQLVSLPPEIGQLNNLKNLNLDQNKLTSLPAEIGQLSQLGTLRLNSTQLTSLPTTIGQLSSLTHLSLSNSPLQSLPGEIGLLTNLHTLEVQNSFTLAYLPPDICTLKRLQKLDLSYNNLRYLPREIGNILKLGILNLSGNWLLALPRQIGQLPHLSNLRLSLNRLTEIPGEIDQLSSLTGLGLDEKLLNNLPARLQALIRVPQWLERKKIVFETGPYYDAGDQVQNPRQVVCAEINVDYSQFYLSDMHQHLKCEQQSITIDNWIQIFDHYQHISFISAAQYHYAWIRMEAWENEPPAAPGSWDKLSELTVIPHSGILVLTELMGGSSAPLELVPGKEPGCAYRMRASCRGREMLADFSTIQWDEDDEDEDDPDPIPHGLEQYLLQFWPV